MAKESVCWKVVPVHVSNVRCVEEERKERIWFVGMEILEKTNLKRRKKTRMGQLTLDLNLSFKQLSPLFFLQLPSFPSFQVQSQSQIQRKQKRKNENKVLMCEIVHLASFFPLFNFYSILPISTQFYNTEIQNSISVFCQKESL